MTTEVVETLDPCLQRIMDRINAMTPEEKAESEKKRADRELENKQERIEVLLQSSNAPKRHRKTPDLSHAGEWGRVEEMIKGRLGTGFLIAMTGIRGSGKTQLAVEVIRQNAALGGLSRYCTAVEFFLEIKAGYGKEGPSEQEVITEFQSPRLLVIDEVGQRSESDWENRLLYELINRRYNDMRDTLVITNQETSQLEASLGPSIVSRMRETGGLIECNWESFRK